MLSTYRVSSLSFGISEKSLRQKKTMSQPNFSNTTATALRRSADAMLRTLGCATISLRLPGIPEGDSTAIQLGAIPIATVDVTFAPALLRAKSPASTAPRQQYEILISAIAVDAAVEAQGLDSAAALFNSALGVVIGDRLLRITAFAAELCAGIAVLYRLSAGE